MPTLELPTATPRPHPSPAPPASATLTAMVDAPMELPPLPPRPLVSVLVCNYNYARFLPAALASLAAQTYDHFEAVICDDGSTDDSVAVIQQHAERDPRIRLVRKPNGGQNSAVNECFRHLTGDVVCLLDADDLFAPDKLKRVVAAFVADPAAGACNHAVRVVDGDGRTVLARLNAHLDAGWLAPTAARRGACVCVPTTSSMSFRREVLAELLPIPATQRRDADGYLGMAAQFLTPFLVIDDPLADYRVHGKNMGGITEPTPERLHYELTLIAERTATLKGFLAARFGAELADAIRMADNPQYVQAALKMMAVDPGHADVRGLDAAALIASHPSPRWRQIWRLIFAAPRPLRRRLIPALHRSHRVKALVQRVFARPTPAGGTGR
jgi:glycosyltransferase involved in cell wall biosynthesis